ncbi:MAG TPA: amidohydrolase family protein [Actinomycetes bacterium]|nr:amidohydrolase family protein [Actinomycetes bacterium]
MSSLTVANGLLVKPTGVTPATVLVGDGRVQALLRPNDRPSAETTIDAGGRYVIPGCIDAHVHLGLSQSFDDACWNESRAAVTGGVTTMMHYLLSAGSFFDIYEEQVKAVEGHAFIDMFFHGLVRNDTQVSEIPRTVEELGITSYKFHMAMKGPEAAYGISGVDDGALYEGLLQVAALRGVMALVHAESIDVILRFRERMIADHPDATDTATWTRYRPAFTEEEAIARATRLAEAAGAPLGIIHNSVGTGPALLAGAKATYPHLYMETCPQYLMLHKDMPLGTWGKVNPPLRGTEDSEMLWSALATGQIDWMGSDHCDYTLATREGSLWDVGPGLPSGMTMILPSLLTGGLNEGRLSLPRIVELTSSTAARLFGLSPRKGTVEVGSDGDLVILDDQREVTITPESLNSFSDYTPYEGLVAKGWARTTIAGGEVLYDRGEVNDAPSRRGRVLRQDRSNPPVL